jgi:hypothetical protein
MSAIKLIPASGGGSVSLAPPNSTSGADVTFTLPSTSASFGKILQVVQNVKLDTATTTSTSFIDTGLSQAITPSSSSHKILCMYSVYTSQGAGGVSLLNLVRGSTNLFQPSPTATNKSTTMIYVNEADMQQHVCQYLDSPNTTSSTTYKVQYKTHDAAILVGLNRYHLNTDWIGTSSLTLMEVAA